MSENRVTEEATLLKKPVPH